MISGEVLKYLKGLRLVMVAGYGAVDGSAYLVRPDLHIAERWYRASEERILRSINECLAREEAIA